MNSLKTFCKSECLRRTLRTFLQAAAGYVVVNVAAADFSTRSAVIGFCVAAVAAGIAAIMNREEGA